MFQSVDAGWHAHTLDNCVPNTLTIDTTTYNPTSKNINYPIRVQKKSAFINTSASNNQSHAGESYKYTVDHNIQADIHQ